MIDNEARLFQTFDDKRRNLLIIFNKQNSFHEHGFLVPGRIERGSVNGAARRGLTKRQSPFAFAFSLSTSACEIFPAWTRACTQAGERLGPAFFNMTALMSAVVFVFALVDRLV